MANFKVVGEREIDGQKVLIVTPEEETQAEKPKKKGVVNTVKDWWNSKTTGEKIAFVVMGAAAGYGLYNFGKGFIGGGAAETSGYLPEADPIIDVPCALDVEGTVI